LRDAGIFRSQDETGKDGLAYRDLLSGCLSGVWSAPALIARLADMPTPVAPLFRSGRLYSQATRIADLTAWLQRYNSPVPENRLTDEEIHELASEPPLPFFLMFEALEHPDTRGLRFGPLGSVIVADALFGIFAKDPMVEHEFDQPIRAALTPFAPIYMSQTALADLPTIESMPDLVRFVARLHRLDGPAPAPEPGIRATPPFI